MRARRVLNSMLGVCFVHLGTLSAFAYGNRFNALLVKVAMTDISFAAAAWVLTLAAIGVVSRA